MSYLIDPTFTIVNRFFVLSFERIVENNPTKDYRDYFSNYYLPNVEIKNFNVLIDGKSFSDLKVNNREEAYEKIIEVNDYTTSNLFYYEYFSNNYKLIAIDLSRQIELENPDSKQQINFIGKLARQDNGETNFFIWKIKKVRRSNFWIVTKTCKHHIKMETQKIVNLLNSSKNKCSKFATKNWSVIYSKSNGNYSLENPIKVLANWTESSLCDYSEGYTLVTGDIAVKNANNANLAAAAKVAFKNCAPFKNSRTGINDIFAD